MKTSTHSTLLRGLRAFSLTSLVLCVPMAQALEAGALVFKQASDAESALISALRAQDTAQILRVIGPQNHDLILSGDIKNDLKTWENFVTAYDISHKLEKTSKNQHELIVGKKEFAFPLPIKAVNEGWQFDATAGINELLNRRIGSNELAAIAVLQQIVLAQDEYALLDRNNNGYAEYAGQIASSPGKQDGLFWPTPEGVKPSPLGPLVAQAEPLGPISSGSDFRGYHFRMLPAQGAAAHGGARQFKVNGLQIGGYAVLAWPSRYATTGIKSFIVNQDGQIYEKDLGASTQKNAANLKVFNPDKSWTALTQ